MLKISSARFCERNKNRKYSAIIKITAEYKRLYHRRKCFDSLLNDENWLPQTGLTRSFESK